MKFVALVSGGKDSYYAIQQALEVGHELVACLHLARPQLPRRRPRRRRRQEQEQPPGQQGEDGVCGLDKEEEDDDDDCEEEEESYMYQSAGSEVVARQVLECVHVPYYEYIRKGKSRQINLLYQPETAVSSDHPQQQPQPASQPEEDDEDDDDYDEVEDLLYALRYVVLHYRCPQTAALDDKENDDDGDNKNNNNKKGIEAVSSGAILSNYQRGRVEYVVCQELKLTSLAYLWRASSQRTILQRQLQAGIDAVLVRTAAPPGLRPRIHLLQGGGGGGSDEEEEESAVQQQPHPYRLSQLVSHFDTLYRLYQFHVCGEGGEYETLCLDAPFFHKRLVIDQVQLELDDDSDDDVGNLRILACHSVDKKVSQSQQPPSTSSSYRPLHIQIPPQDRRRQRQQHPIEATAATGAVVSLPLLLQPGITCLPRVQMVTGGLLHISEISSSTTVAAAAKDEDNDQDNNDTPDEIQRALLQQEAQQVLTILEYTLKHYGCVPQDVVMVHLYLSQMSHFTSINVVYQALFGTVLPPSRSCIAIAASTSTSSSQTPRITLDCLVQRRSGRALRSNNNNNTSPQPQLKQRRQVLHVQSRSFWAPVCVGPYSQANTIWNAIHYLAGQIGLNPSTMTLVTTTTPTTTKTNNQKQPTLPPLQAAVEGGGQGAGYSNNSNCTCQLQQTWTNIAQVLDALDQGSSLVETILSCLIYVPLSVWNPSSQESSRQNNSHNNNDADEEEAAATTTSSRLLLSSIQQSCLMSLTSNGGVIPGFVDKGEIVLDKGGGVGGAWSTNADNNDDFDGYEDEGTMQEMMMTKKKKDQELQEKKKEFPPILIVSVEALPVGAEIEVEVVAATLTASNCLHRTIPPAIVNKSTLRLHTTTTSTTTTKSTTAFIVAASTTRPKKNVWKWDTGQENDDDCGGGGDGIAVGEPGLNGHNNNDDDDSDDGHSDCAVVVSSHMCTLGRGCAGYAIVTVSIPPKKPWSFSPLTTPTSTTTLVIPDAEFLMETALKVLEQSLQKEQFTWEQLLHIRLYYLVVDSSSSSSSSSSLPDRLRSALAVAFATRKVRPAMTLVPVYAMDLLLLFNHHHHHHHYHNPPHDDDNNNDLRTSTSHGGDPTTVKNSSSSSSSRCRDQKDKNKTSTTAINTTTNNNDDVDNNSQKMILAMQATFVDPLNLETELWIRSNR